MQYANIFANEFQLASSSCKHL